MKTKLVTLIFSLFLGITCWATNDYVATNGNDRSSGSLNGPIATLENTIDAVEAGDASGTSVYMDGNKSATAVFVKVSGNAASSASEGDEIHNFTESGLTSSFYNISGNLSTSKGTVTYNGLTLTQCLKIESSTSITFTSTQDGTLTLVFNEGWSGGFVVDGTSQDVSSGILTVDLAAGYHSLSKDNVANLYYISLSNGSTPSTQTYTVSTSVNGSGSVSGGGTYDEGTQVILTASPSSGWQFDNWSGDVSGTSENITLTVSSDISAVANFSEIPVSGSEITIQENETGFCSVDGSVDNNHLDYTGTGFANTDNATGNGIDYKVNVVTAGTYTITIRYSATSDRPANLIQNGSTVYSNIAMPATSSWDVWNTVSVSAYLSSGVSDLRLEATGSSGLPNVDYLTLSGPDISAYDCNGTVTYTVSTSVSGSGSVTGAGTYDAGTVISLSATAAVGYVFDSWSGDASGSTNPLSITVNSDLSITANFTAESTTPVDNSMIGYATVSGDGYTTTTGGAGGSSTTVSSLDALLTWASNREGNTTPEILYISGKISASSTTVVTVKHGANISILGLGSTAELQNIGLNIWDYENVIVRNLKIHEVFYPDDDLTIDACNHVWVDHCELHSIIGDGIGYDTYDGLLDIKRGSKYVTVSWCYLHDHMKTMLIGHTDNTSQQATDSEMRITLHHNYYENTDGRNPSLRYGAVHMFNNYFNNITDYGLAARDGAHALVENCHYNNVKLSMSTDKFPVAGLPNGYICQSGNIFTGTTGAPVISQTGCDWWNLPYSYTLDPVSTVATNVPANVGVGKIVELKAEDEAITAGLTNGLNNLEVYPNPFSGSTQINFELASEQKVSFRLVDLTGRLVDVVEPNTYAAGNNQVIYKNADLNPGVYILSAYSGTNIKNIRLVVK